MKDTSEDTRDLADGVVVPEEPVLHQEVLVEGALLVLDVVEEAVETRRRLTTVGLATGRPLVVDVDEDGGARTHDDRRCRGRPAARRGAPGAGS